MCPPCASAACGRVFTGARSHNDKIEFYKDVPQILHRLRAADVTIAACSRTHAPALYVHYYLSQTQELISTRLLAMHGRQSAGGAYFAPRPAQSRRFAQRADPRHRVFRPDGDLSWCAVYSSSSSISILDRDRLPRFKDCTLQEAAPEDGDSVQRDGAFVVYGNTWSQLPRNLLCLQRYDCSFSSTTRIGTRKSNRSARLASPSCTNRSLNRQLYL